MNELNLSRDISAYIDHVFSSFTKRPRIDDRGKFFNDSVWGRNHFKPLEVAMIDLPFVQRLRRIGQVDVACLTYISANHNRFEHTIGVASVASKMANVIEDYITNDEEGKRFKKYFTFNLELWKNNIITAAILHDIGHGPFSHQSEDVYKQHKDFKKAEAALVEQYGFARDANEHISQGKPKAPAPHEIMAYYMITNERFKVNMDNHIGEVYEDALLDYTTVAKYIIGISAENEEPFTHEIVNGLLDADKIDYILRDAYYSGLRLPLDYQRLFETIKLQRDSKNKIRLSVDVSGVAVLQQIVFSRMMLHTQMYSQHTVRASDALLGTILTKIHNTKIWKGLPTRKATGFLYLNDSDVIALANRRDCKVVCDLTRRLLQRELPKRALVMSIRTIKPECAAEYFGFLRRIRENGSNEIRRRILEGIWRELDKQGIDIEKESIWVSVAKYPDSAEQDFVLSYSADEEGQPLKNCFGRELWDPGLDALSTTYVYTWKNDRKTIHETAKKVIQEELKIELTDLAWKLCKAEKKGK